MHRVARCRARADTCRLLSVRQIDLWWTGDSTGTLQGVRSGCDVMLMLKRGARFFRCFDSLTGCKHGVCRLMCHVLRHSARRNRRAAQTRRRLSHATLKTLLQRVCRAIRGPRGGGERGQRACANATCRRDRAIRPVSVIPRDEIAPRVCVLRPRARPAALPRFCNSDSLRPHQVKEPSSCPQLGGRSRAQGGKLATRTSLVFYSSKND